MTLRFSGAIAVVSRRRSLGDEVVQNGPRWPQAGVAQAGGLTLQRALAAWWPKLPHQLYGRAASLPHCRVTLTLLMLFSLKHETAVGFPKWSRLLPRLAGSLDQSVHSLIDLAIFIHYESSEIVNGDTSFEVA